MPSFDTSTDELIQLIEEIAQREAKKIIRGLVQVTKPSVVLPNSPTKPSGFTTPMTTIGDTMYGGQSGALARLGIGTEGQVWTVTDVGGNLQPRWRPGLTSGTPASASLFFDGNGSALPAGQVVAFQVPYAVTIDSWAIQLGAPGNFSVQVEKSTTTNPAYTVISTGGHPAVSADDWNGGSTSGWADNTVGALQWVRLTIIGTPTAVTAGVSLQMTRT